MHVTAIIAAGGRGARMGGGRPKQLLAIDGRTLLERSVEAFTLHPAVDELVVAVTPEMAADPPACLRTSVKPLRSVVGGARRQDSVSNAFDAASPATEIVLVHDAARPFVSADLIGRTIAAAAAYGAAVAAIGATDTVKRVRGEEERVVVETIPRETVFLAQTPQAFRRDVLAAAVALGRSGVVATDEAALAERAGFAVHVVAGEPDNVKITTADDLEAARRGASPQAVARTGLGYDLHRLVAGRPLILGGVVIPSDKGAAGHSDADVVCHAATDAILGAATAGDIGSHFPDSDPRWKDARSLDLLAMAAAIVAGRGLAVGNIDVTVVLESPRLRAHIDDMRRSVAAAVGIDPDAVSIKAKTNEGVDAIGRGEAIAAQAIALLRRV